MNPLLISLTHFRNKLQQHPFFTSWIFFFVLGLFSIASPSLAASEKTLEELFEEVTVTGTIDPLDYTNEMVIDIPTIGQLNLNFSLMLEEAGFADRNMFGLYDTVTQNHFPIFGGEDSLGSQLSATLTSDNRLLIGDMTYDVAGPLSFYLGRQDKKRFQTFYSNDSHRGISQALVYQGSGQELSLFGINTTFTHTSYMLAFEDVKAGKSDQDYNDMVVFAEALLQLPEPEPQSSQAFLASNDVRVPEPSILSGLAMIATLALARKQTSQS